MDSTKPVVSQSHIKTTEPEVEDAKKSGGTVGDNLNKPAPSRVSSPVKQREYRRPDGRKRIIPEAVGVPVHPENISAGTQGQALEFSNLPSDIQKDDNGMLLVDGGPKETYPKRPFVGSSEANNISGKCCHCGVKERLGPTARAQVTENLVIEKVPVSSISDGTVNVEQSGLTSTLGCQASCNALSIRVFNKKEGKDSLPVCLEAKPIERALNDMVGAGNTYLAKETEVTCKRGLETVWSDRISGKVTVLAGNVNFWAVGCEDGCLQLYTKCGRRTMPSMMMGSAAVFIDCDESWKLLLVTRRGSIYVWDLFNRTCLVHDSLSSLITLRQDSKNKDTGTIKVISARFSRSGAPLVVLATRHAFLFDMSMKCWLRIADDCFPGSNFASSWNLGSAHSGELASLQVDVGKFLARKPSWSRVTDDGVQTRAHLEAQLASSLALKSPNEYCQCLLAYVRFLAREADESRLREVCETFLGPPTGMTESASSDAKHPAWEPHVLGMTKRKLLREDILPAIASNRKVQRLLNEFMDLLSEYENIEAHTDQVDPALPKEDTPKDNVNSGVKDILNNVNDTVKDTGS